MTCPKCNEVMVYKNQDYVSHGWYCKCGHHERCDQSCCDVFITLNKDEAERRGIVGPHYMYRNTCQVIVELDNGILRPLACDGGEPEDQLFCRDLKWIVPSLNAAYKAGYKQGQLHKGSEER